jgi:hypothetical protein
MMLAGCYGLLRAAAAKVPEWRDAVEARLAVDLVSTRYLGTIE